jgi:hypothetical protein
MKRSFAFLFAGLCAATVARCGSDDNSNFDGGPVKDATSPDSNPFPQGDGAPSTYSDFPSNPIVDSSLPGNIGTLFGSPDAGASAAPCVAEPADDAMIPKNWTPLFLEYASSGANVFEIRLAVDNQTNQAVIYVPTVTYTLDTSIWKQLALHSSGHDIVISIRAGTLNGTTLTNITSESVETVHIAPVDAPGSVVYWSSTGGTSFKGFTVGDTTSKTVLTPTTASPASAGAGTVYCVSCHTSSPDGTYIFYTRDVTPTGSLRAIDARTVTTAATPNAADVSPSALALLARDHEGAPILNAQHYSASDSIALSVLYDPTATGSPNYQLVWTDLHAVDATGSGVVARTGDPNAGISSPAWSHDGNTIAYVSADSSGEAVIANGGNIDIYTVPYNNHAGGAATKLTGASDPNYHEFYPIYSPDDTMLAFNRTASTCNYGADPSQQCGSSYNQVAAEVFVVPGAGGSALRLRANDPPTCTTLVSPGLTNAWPRWAPAAQAFTSGGAQYKYYWLIFSSKRRPATGLNPQLYVSAIVTKVTNNTETIYADYPAVYVPAQDPTQNNHTPAWDNFDVQGIVN